jgi:hypothetical protein
MTITIKVGEEIVKCTDESCTEIAHEYLRSFYGPGFLRRIGEVECYSGETLSSADEYEFHLIPQGKIFLL